MMWQSNRLPDMCSSNIPREPHDCSHIVTCALTDAHDDMIAVVADSSYRQEGACGGP